jgi:hypothetical protein
MFDGKYVMWGGEHSLFTRKLQAMLNYLGVDYEFRFKTQEAGPHVEARWERILSRASRRPKGGSYTTLRPSV